MSDIELLYSNNSLTVSMLKALPTAPLSLKTVSLTSNRWFSADITADAVMYSGNSLMILAAYFTIIIDNSLCDK